VGGIFVICMSILLLIFIPKMKYLKKWKKNSSPGSSNLSGIQVLNHPKGDELELKALSSENEQLKLAHEEDELELKLLRAENAQLKLTLS